MNPSGAASAPSDEDLMVRIASGDDAALGSLYDRHATAAFSVAAAIVGDHHDAEDVVARAFAQVWRRARDYEAGRGSVQAWLNTIVRSRALDLLRARGRRLRRVQAMAEDFPGTFASSPAGADNPGAAAVQQSVRGSLQQLPERERVAIELAYWHGMSQSEIAEHLDEPLGTIKTRVRSGMQRLRQVLAPPKLRGRS